MRITIPWRTQAYESDAMRAELRRLDQLERLEPDPEWDLGDYAAAACLLEATAPKVGNVHPGAAFDDMRYEDFVNSAFQIAPIFAEAQRLPVGQLILRSVVATREATTVNTNLGTLLLLGPLAKARVQERQTNVILAEQDIMAFLRRMFTADDARWIYEAIRYAKPGGMGSVEAMDIQDAPPHDILAAMQLAASRDMIAWEYAHGFPRVQSLARRLNVLCHSPDELSWRLKGRQPVVEVKDGQARARSDQPTWSEVIVQLQLELLADAKDTLIERKCGPEIAEEVRRQARDVIEGRLRLIDLDRFLRRDGHRLNPGSSADLIAAALFWYLSQRWEGMTNDDLESFSR
jgi:triphosphoribosyl-dephospho-CoA synthase